MLQILDTKFVLYPVPIEGVVEVNEEDTVAVVEVIVEAKETAGTLLCSILKTIQRQRLCTNDK